MELQKKKMNIQNYVNLTGICVHYMYGLFGFAKKLNIQSRVNSMGNCVYYMYRFFGFAKKIKYSK